MAEQLPIRSRIATVPIGTDFCDATVSHILEICGDRPDALSDALILLPNNRAAKAMTEAFVRRVEGGLLLPRLVAVGDLALDEALGPFLDPLADEQPVPPVIPPAERLLLLAELVTKQAQRDGRNIMAAEAIRLARKLAEMIDELEIEQKTETDLLALKDESQEGAGHWDIAYSQVSAILPQYRSVLAERSMTGPAERRNALLERLTDRLRSGGHSAPIMAAGITTSAWAIAKLLRQVAVMPNGLVILPAVDLAMPEEEWAQLGPHEPSDEGIRSPRAHETHPQFHLKLLLHRMSARREEVEALAEGSPSAQSLSDIFCLPNQTAKWQDYPAARKKLPHIELFEAADSAEEARAIAITIRGALETPGRRVAVVTPDRELALRVTTQLKRWDIDIDDSAGLPLAQTPHGTLILAIATAYADRFSPVSLLAIAKHPLVKAGEERLPWLEHVRQFDLALRGPSTGAGLEAIMPRLVAAEERHAWRKPSLDWWPEYEALLKPLADTGTRSFSSLMTAVGALAGKLTDDAIWRGATGRQLAGLWDEYLGCNLAVLDHAERTALPTILTEMFGRAVVRPPYGGHPRVAIFGLLEARLQRADLIICGGLNDGTWPQLPQADPWLSPAMRRKLGLATLERNIGLSAHDLLVALGAGEVLLTRAKRDRSGPSVASRFLLRIRALLGTDLREAEDLATIVDRLDEPVAITPLAPRPAPMPSAEQRKIGLSITDFDRLKADPYSIYAKRILKLTSLDPVASEPSHAWRGTFVHDILEKWFKEDKCAPEALTRRAKELLRNADLDPVLRALWQPRVMEGLRWIAEETARLAAEGREPLVAEVDGKIDMSGVTVRGRVDRIDRNASGDLVIIDYKTGQPPKPKQIKAGFALQLGLVGMMAEAGVLDKAKGHVGGFEYWSLAKGKEGFGYIDDPTKKRDAVPSDTFVATAIREAEAAIEKWINGSEAFGAKLQPDFANYDDYDQLMRLQEWNGRQPIAEVKIDG